MGASTLHDTTQIDQNGMTSLRPAHAWQGLSLYLVIFVLRAPIGWQNGNLVIMNCIITSMCYLLVYEHAYNKHFWLLDDIVNCPIRWAITIMKNVVSSVKSQHETQKLQEDQMKFFLSYIDPPILC